MFTRRATILILALALAASPATAKSVIYKDPRFAKIKPLEHGAAFIVWGGVDVGAIGAEFDTEFDGSRAAGEAYARAALVERLAGRVPIREPSKGITDNGPMRLNLVDLRASARGDSIVGDLAVATDSADVVGLSVLRPDSLKASLAAAHTPYLVVICSARATLTEFMTPPTVLFGPNGSMTHSPPGRARYVELVAQVFVLRAETLAVVWNGFIAGRNDVGRFRKSSIDRVADDFASSLAQTLH